MAKREEAEAIASTRIEASTEDSDEALEGLKKALEQDAILIWDAETGTILDCNRAASKLAEREKSELVGKHRRTLHPLQSAGEEYCETCIQHPQKVREQTLETQITTKSGETKDIIASFSIFELGGRKVVQEALRCATEQRFSESFRSEERFPETADRESADRQMRCLVYKLNDVSPGECYLHKSHEDAYSIFTSLSLRGIPSLCISRERPDKLTKNYDIPKESIVLLSSMPLEGFKAVESLQDISITISLFLNKNAMSIVLLDGLEYLISRSDFNAVFRFVQEMRFTFINSNSTLLLPLDPCALTERQKALLLSELKLK